MTLESSTNPDVTGMNVKGPDIKRNNEEQIPKLRMSAYERMEALLHQMRDAETGVPVKCQRTFMNTIPSVFTGCDLVEWLTEKLGIEDTCEALNFCTMLCQYGYFFPVSDTKSNVVKEDNSLFRFQNPSLWPGQKHTNDSTEYAIYLVKRVMKNKPKNALEEYEQLALSQFRKLLSHKWEFIIQQAEEQLKSLKDYKKNDRLVMESQEKAYWRLRHPPPGGINYTEPCPIPNRRPSSLKKRYPKENYHKELDYLNQSLLRTRLKTSQALDGLIHNHNVYSEYDPFITPPEPSNPWITDDDTLWSMNTKMAEFPSEKRVRKWAISLKDLLLDPRGQWEFEIYLRKEYSGENLRFWLAVEDLKRSAKILVENRVMEIYNEFLGPGAPNEVNVDGRTIEVIHQNIRVPNRYTYNEAQEHVFNLMKKDSYPRFLRSDNYRNILENAGHASQKKRFTFAFGSKKKNSLTPPDKKESVDKRRGSSCSDKGKYVDMDSSHEGVGVMEMIKCRIGGQHSLSTSDLLDIDGQKCKIQQCSRLSSPSQSKSNINNDRHTKNSSKQLDVPRRSPVSSQSIDVPDNPCVSLCVPSTRRKSSTCSNSSNVVAPWEDLDI